MGVETLPKYKSRRFQPQAMSDGSPLKRSDAFRQMHRAAAFLTAQERCNDPLNLQPTWAASLRWPVWGWTM